MLVQVKRNGVNTVQLPLNAATYSNKVMAEHGLSFSIGNVASLELRVGDTLVYKGEEYTLNQVEDFKKMSRFVSSFDFVFEGPRHTLTNLFLDHLGARKFSFSGTAEEWLHLFVDCANSKSSGWSVGSFEDLGRVTVEFDSTYILDALTMVAQAMKAEWGIKGKEMSLKKTVGTPRALTFEYGKGKGLYSLTRKSLQDKKIVTRAYARGGDKNLPEGVFGYFTIPGYVEKNTPLYGIREGEFIDEEIYPKRTGTVTKVEQIDKTLFSISDTSIDFDLNGQKVEGETPYIVFKSGLLEGNQFEITSYNHSTKTVRFKANDEGNDNWFPSETVHAEIGDKYTLIGIRMPQSYIDAAAAELIAKRQEYLDSNSVPRVVYELEIDYIQLKRLNTNLDAGDIVRLVDADKGIDAEIRITEVSCPAIYPDVIENGMSFDAVIGNEVTYTFLEKMQNDIKEQKEVVTQYNKQSWERDRRNVQALTEFRSKVFDPDGNLEKAMQQAIAGWFGTESMYYDLDDVTMSVNLGGNSNAFAMSAGRLIHKVYKIDGLGNIWNLTAFSQSGLIPTQGYYLSAKCSKTALTGEWVLSPTQIPTDGEAGYWHFNFGYLTTVIEGERSFNPTKGFTLISGGQIETDVITAYLINVNRLFAQVITVGSDGYVNAGISGLNDRGPLSQRYWSGANEENRYEAPFQVLDDGSMRAFKGRIGGFDITQDNLKIGTDDSWDVNGQYVFMSRHYFVMRANGLIRGQRREFAWNLYNDNNIYCSASIFNTISTADTIFPKTNIALELEASNGNSNYALVVNSGLTKLRGVVKSFQRISASNQTIDDEISRVFINNNVVAGNLYLPTYPELGYEVTIQNLSPNDFFVVSNNGSIIQADGTPTTSNFFRRYSIKTFMFDGDYWREGFSISH